MQVRLIRLGLVACLSLAMFAGSSVSAQSSLDAPNKVRGKFAGDWEATAGQLNGQEGRVTFQIKQQKKSRSGAFTLKGSGKFGNYQTQELNGAYDPRSGTLTVTRQTRSTNQTIRHHSLTLTFQGNKTWTGQFSITNIRRENIGGGNVTITKK